MEGGCDFQNCVLCILLLAYVWLLILVCNLVTDFLGPKYFVDEKVGNEWSDNTCI
jgi:hypothetical protein